MQDKKYLVLLGLFVVFFAHSSWAECFWCPYPIWVQWDCSLIQLSSVNTPPQNSENTTTAQASSTSSNATDVINETSTNDVPEQLDNNTKSTTHTNDQPVSEVNKSGKEKTQINKIVSTDSESKTEACKSEPSNQSNLYFHLESGKYQITIRKLEDGKKPQYFEKEFKIDDKAVNLTDIKFEEWQACSVKILSSTVKEISINGRHKLQFVEIVTKDNPLIDISIRENQARIFLDKAQKLRPQNASPLVPFIFRAVSDAPAQQVISTFWIQKEPINSELYKSIICNGSSNQVSYNEAQKVIKYLNELCKDKQIKFALPTERQFVYLARESYDPVNNQNYEFKSCHDLKSLEPHGVKKVFGYNWQLTSSYCSPLDPYNSDPSRACDSEQYYVKKGGSIDSIDATECLPEYRAESVPDLGEPNTTFRLILYNFSK